MSERLREYEVRDLAYPNEIRMVAATNAGRARMEVARSLREFTDEPMGKILSALRVRSLSPRRLPPPLEPTTLDAFSHELLRHALGASHPDTPIGWRNWYCAPTEPCRERDAWEAMVAAGLAERGGTITEGRERYYRATDAGKAEAAKPAAVAPALPGAEGERRP